jgi:hypothetical protein
LPYQAESRARRAVHNRLLDLLGPIRVFVRPRPLLEADLEQREALAVGDEREGPQTLVVRTTKPGGTEPVLRRFEVRPGWSVAAYVRGVREWVSELPCLCARDAQFDRVFPLRASQADVFEEVRPLVTSVVDGFSVCVFAYGQVLRRLLRLRLLRLVRLLFLG